MTHQIIKSLLDSDLYKFSQQWAVIQKFPNTKATYNFINRDGRKFSEEMCDEVYRQIHLMKNLYLEKFEASFLKEKCKFLPAAYIDFLFGYRYDPDEITIDHTDDDELIIKISGYWYRTILWEVPIMAIVSEVYNNYCGNIPTEDGWNEFRKRNNIKGNALKGLTYADFGTRRRLSFQAQKIAVQWLRLKGLMGTSNVKLAMDLNLKPIGTQAHEWHMAHGAIYGYKSATEMALNNWADVYQGSLGIALTDTYTSDVFFKYFNLKFAKLFDGVRHDSSDPILFADKTIQHYRSLGIDPRDKTIVFSDALNIEKVIRIQEYCKGKIRTSYGIGTFLTNDFEGVKPLNIVIKLDTVNDSKCIKLSDDEGKHTGNEKEIDLCKQILKLT